MASKHSRILLCTACAVGILVAIFCALQQRQKRSSPGPVTAVAQLRSRMALPTTWDNTENQWTQPAIQGVVTTNCIATVSDLRLRLGQMTALKHGRERMDMVFELGKELGATDFTNAVALVKQLPSQLDWQRSVLYSGIFFSRGREEAQSVIERLAAADKSDENDLYDLGGVNGAFAAGGAIVGWADADPRAALACARGEKDDSMLMRLAYASWGLKDLDAALAYAKALPPGLSNIAGKEDFMSWAKSDPARAFDYAMTLEDDLRTTVIERIAHGWASNWTEDYRTDFVSLLSIAVREDPEDFLQTSAYAWWSKFDPQAAAEDAATLEEESERHENLEGVLTYWAESDAARTLEWMKKYLEQHEEGGKLVEKIVNNLREVNPEVAAQMLDSIPSLTDDADLRFRVFSSWADGDPRLAFDWISKKGIDPEALVAATRTVAVKWSQLDSDEALDWAQSLTDQTLQASAFDGLALAEGYADRDRSPDWIRALPPGKLRDQAICSFVIGALDHAKGSQTPEPGQLENAPANLSQAEALVRQSDLNEQDKWRLFGLIYGWVN